MKAIAFDTEDNSKGDVSIINFFDGLKHTTFTGEKLKKKSMDFVFNSSENMFFAHNLEYDLINLSFPYFINQFEFYYIGGRLLYAKLKNTKKKFFDSFNFSFTSLKNIGQVIGLEKMETEDFFNIEYCQRDTEIVFYYMKYFNDTIKQEFNLKPKISLAGTAQNIFLRRFDKNWLGGKNIEPELLNAYYGGRCECFKIGTVNNYVFETDINSSYPNVMKNYKYPVCESYETIIPEEKLFISKVKIKVNDCKYPVLPLRGERLDFPVGEFITWITSPELKLAESEGQIESIEYLKTFNFPLTDFVFKDFVDYFYSKRIEAKKTGDTFKSNYYKLILNSTYGRFALRNGLQELTTDGIDFNMLAIEIENNRNINFSIALFVTAYARIELYLLLKKVLSSRATPLYCDTDSVYFHFEKKIDLQETIKKLHTILPVNNELGNVSLTCYTDGYFINAKQYMVTSFNDTIKIKCKGIPEKNRKEFFETNKTSYERPIKLRTYLHSIDKTFPPNYWKQFFTQKISEYKKRDIIPSRKKLKDTTPKKYPL